MQVTKNQHYVPRCLLRFFSWKSGNERRTNVYDITRDSFRYNQSIKKICSQSYFYDKDNIVEDILSKNIETPAAPLISALVHHDTTALDVPENWMRLISFVSTLLHRTPKSLDKIDSIIQTNIQSFSHELLRLNGMDFRSAGKGRLNIKDEATLVSLITLQGYYASILLTDLEVNLAVNKTGLDFLISDHPVFMYNWLYRKLDHPGVTSFGSRGLQLFLPLSPKLVLCLYDPKVYKYGTKGGLLTDIYEEKDVEILNSFQAINSKSFVVFADRKSETDIRPIIRRYGNKQLHTQRSIEGEIPTLGSEAARTRHIVYSEQIKIGAMPSFVKVKRRANRSLYEIRNQEAFEYFVELTRAEHPY